MRIGRLATFVAASTITTIAVAACGKVRQSVEPRMLSQAASDACRATAVALCARALECSPPLVDFFFGSRPDCESDVYTRCASRYEGSGSSHSPASCADVAAASISCERIQSLVSLTEVGADALMRECPVTGGAFSDGVECLDHGDCASGFCARPTSRSTPTTFGTTSANVFSSASPEAKLAFCGRCAPAPKEGEPCSALGQCAPPLRCDRRGGATTCERVRVTGDLCRDDLACSVSRCGGDGHCEGWALEGEYCDSQRGPYCNLGVGLVCDEEPFAEDEVDPEKRRLRKADHRCKPLFIVGLGEPCDNLDLNYQPGTRFCAGAWTGRNNCISKRCTASDKHRTLEFAACTTTKDCDAAGTCVNGHCRAACVLD